MEKPHPDGLCGKSVVVVDDSSQHISPDHDAFSIRFNSGDGCLLFVSLMGSGTIVECHKLLQYVVEMSFIHDENVIQTFLSSLPVVWKNLIRMDYAVSR